MKRFSKILFYLLMVLFFFPIAQQNFKIVDAGKLHGAIKKVEKPGFSMENWFSEKFQKETEKYVSQNFGFANWFVRFGNQIQYSFFNKAKANGVVIGKHNYLYEKSYIGAYYGNDFLGDSTIQSLYGKLKTIADTLEKLNTRVLIVFAPGKASFYPEFIPDHLKSDKKTTNIEYCVKTADALGLDYIDMSSWFIKMKDTATYPLFPKTGIHWSYYGVKLATDSLVSYCREKYHLKLPDYLWGPIETSSELKNTDVDIEKGMNLLFDIPNHPMPYVTMGFLGNKAGPASSIVVADSYYWQLYNMGISSKLFEKGQFWFYNKKVYPSKKGKAIVSQLDIRAEILNHDLVILLTTEPVLKRKYWGFVDMAYQAIFDPEQVAHKAEIEKIVNNIKGNPKWMESIKKKALTKNISVDSMLILDAEYTYKNKRK